MNQHPDVRGALELALARTPCISGAAYFGSTGVDQSDGFSDIDLVVRCAPDRPGRFLVELHAILAIVLFRPFSEDRKPDGRYWFADTNPFARLDVSFHDGPEFDKILHHGGGFAQPPFRVIPVRPTPGPAADGELPGWSQLDYGFVGALRRFHESSKRVARRLEPGQPVDAAEASVLSYRGQALRPEIWDLYRGTLEVLDRGGGSASGLARPNRHM
jgi:predicted nucleotidyltransferase